MHTIELAAAVPPVPGSWAVITGAGYYVGLSVAVGAGLATGFLAARDAGADGVAARVRLVLPALAGFVGLTAVLSCAAQRGGHHEPAVPVLQLALSALLVAAMLAASRRASRALDVGVLGLGVLIGLLPNLPTSATSANAVAKGLITALHVLGATTWVGGLLVLAVVGLLGRRMRLDGAGTHALAADWQRVWTRYSVVALYAVGAILLSGSWLAWVHVGSVAQLATTAYGRYLAIKLVLVAGMLVLGALNHTVLIPRIAAARAAGATGTVVALAVRRLPALAAIEALIGVAVLTVVPFFAGSARSQAGSGAARPFDLTVFGTGVLLAGLIAVALWTGSRVRVPMRLAEDEHRIRA